MIISGIDPSMTPGLCVMDETKILLAMQVTDLKPKPLHKGDKPNPSLFNVRYEDWLRSVLVANKVDHLAYELPIPAGQIASNAAVHEMANYMKGHAEALCARLGIGFHGVHIQSWRSFFIGKTQAPKNQEVPEHILPHRKKDWQAKARKDWWKDQAIKRCAELGVELKSHDAAESVGVAAYLHGQIFPNSYLKGADLFSGEIGRTKIEGTISLTKEPFIKPAVIKTKADIMAEAESLFKK